MERSSSYFLGFGKFAGKTPEQLMFSSEGYGYLQWLKKNHHGENGLFQRINEVLEQGENPPVVKRCQCGNPVKWISYAGDPISGYIFGEFSCCDSCIFSTEKIQFVAVKFSSLRYFYLKNNQKTFLKWLKYCLFGDSKTRITAKKALNFFHICVNQPSLFRA